MELVQKHFEKIKRRLLCNAHIFYYTCYMKYNLLLIAVICIFSSCRLTQKMGYTPSRIQPLVQLKDKQVIHCKKVVEMNDGIFADSMKYKKNIVEKYATDKSTYFNTGYKDYIGPKPKRYLDSIGNNAKFAKLTDSGDINVYLYTYYTPVQYSSPSYNPYTHRFSSGMASSGGAVSYIRKGDTGSMVSLTYNSVKNMLSPNERAYKYIDMYKRERWVGVIDMVGGFFLFFGGFIVGVEPPRGNRIIANVAGMASLTGGFYIIRGFAVNANIKTKFAWGAIAVHNGVMVDKKKFRRRYCKDCPGNVEK